MLRVPVYAALLVTFTLIFLVLASSGNIQIKLLRANSTLFSPNTSFTVNSPLKIPRADGALDTYTGRTKGISWSFINQNEAPDLYLNHHGQKHTFPNFPAAHIIFDPGYGFRAGNHRTLSNFDEGGGDQHGALFMDFDNDGSVDLLQTYGGWSGKAKLENKDTWNGFFKDSNENQQNREAAFEKGLADPAARAYSSVPFRIGDDLFIALMNLPAPNNKAPSKLLIRDGSVFVPHPHAGTCKIWVDRSCLENLPSQTRLRWGFLNDDKYPDLIFHDLYLNERRQSETLLLLSESQGVYRSQKIPKFDTLLDAEIGYLGDSLRGYVIFSHVGGISIYSLNTAGKLKSVTSFSTIDIYQNEIEEFKIKESDFTKFSSVFDFDNDTRNEIVSLHSRRNSINKLINPKKQIDKDYILIWHLDDTFNIEHIEIIILDELGCSAQGFAFADANVDGSMDMVVATGQGDPDNCKGGYGYFEGNTRGNWIQVDLHDQQGLDGLGAHVTFETRGSNQISQQDLGVRYFNQDSSRLHFGLADAEAGLLRVVWTDKVESTFIVDRVNRVIDVYHPSLNQ